MNKYTDQKLKQIDWLIQQVQIESTLQIHKWGIQTRTAFEWMTFLTEEVGELAEAISEYEYRNGTRPHVIEEAIQVATLALKIAEMYATGVPHTRHLRKAVE